MIFFPEMSHEFSLLHVHTSYKEVPSYYLLVDKIIEVEMVLWIIPVLLIEKEKVHE